MSKLRLSSCSALAAALFALQAPALAGPTAPEPTPAKAATPTAPETEFTALVAVTHLFDSGLDRTSASVATTRVALEVEYDFRLGGRWFAEIQLEGDYSSYQLHKFTSLVPGRSRVLKDAVLVDIVPLIGYELNRGWSILGGGRLEIGAASGASLRDSVTVAGILAVRHSFFNGAIILTLGGSFGSRLGGGTQVLPFLQLDSGRNSDILGSRFGFETRHNGGQLTYRLTDSILLLVGGRLDEREYRLASGSQGQRGVWRESGLELGGGVGFAPAKNWRVSVTGGVEVGRTIRLDDRFGGKIFERDVAPSPFVSVEMHATF